MWLGQSLLYTVLLSFVALHEAGCLLRGSRLARETGVLRFHGILRVINTLYPYFGLV
jgi:hypothetical protein